MTEQEAIKKKVAGLSDGERRVWLTELLVAMPADTISKLVGSLKDTNKVDAIINDLFF